MLVTPGTKVPIWGWRSSDTTSPVRTARLCTPPLICARSAGSSDQVLSGLPALGGSVDGPAAVRHCGRPGKSRSRTGALVGPGTRIERVRGRSKRRCRTGNRASTAPAASSAIVASFCTSPVVSTMRGLVYGRERAGQTPDRLEIGLGRSVPGQRSQYCLEIVDRQRGGRLLRGGGTARREHDNNSSTYALRPVRARVGKGDRVRPGQRRTRNTNAAGWDQSTMPSAASRPPRVRARDPRSMRNPPEAVRDRVVHPGPDADPGIARCVFFDT